MDHFRYRDGTLFAEEVPLPRLAAEVGTPAYVYSAATLRRHARVMRQALAPLGDPLIAFAVKANSNLAVLKLLGAAGLGADVVSAGELQRALAAGIDPRKIVFSGVGKTDAELEAALAAGILQLNVESESELRRLSRIAVRMGTGAEIAFRVNPDIDAHTHAKISTGRADNKFGIPIGRVEALYAEATALPGIRAVGVAVHIGSQLADLLPVEQAVARLGTLVAALRRAGHEVCRVDLGGGLGIPYDPGAAAPPTPAEYGERIRRAMAGWPERDGIRLLFEPGRLIAGNAGLLLSRVVVRKRGAAREFVVLDAAMNDLLRPALYGAHHDIRAVVPRPGTLAATIVGPVCETGDTFAEERTLPPLEEGDLVALMTAGAYGAVMSGTYNSRPLVPEILVDGSRYAVIRPRQTLDEQLALDRVPEWL